MKRGNQSIRSPRNPVRLMSISLYEGRIKQARRDLERATKRRAAEEKKAAAADRGAARLQREAGRTKSTSLAQGKLDRAARRRDEATKARAAAAKASDAAAEAQRKLGEAEQKLAAEKAKLERRAREKAERERARQEKARERELSDLRSNTAQLADAVAAAPWAHAPAAITVLFIAASPEDQDPLRLDREVREIQRRVRMSEHRDAVSFEWRPASQVTDLLQILNETRPHIVHFSGHGDQHALAFEDADGLTKPLDNASLAALLHASSDRIRLAVFNSCESSSQAELACEHLDAAIGMERPVDDESAKVFAGQFYNSIGFGKSLQQAFDQAKLQLELETGGLSGNPELYVAPASTRPRSSWWHRRRAIRPDRRRCPYRAATILRHRPLRSALDEPAAPMPLNSRASSSTPRSLRTSPRSTPSPRISAARPPNGAAARRRSGWKRGSPARASRTSTRAKASCSRTHSTSEDRPQPLLGPRTGGHGRRSRGRSCAGLLDYRQEQLALGREVVVDGALARPAASEMRLTLAPSTPAAANSAAAASKRRVRWVSFCSAVMRTIIVGDCPPILPTQPAGVLGVAPRGRFKRLAAAGRGRVPWR